MVMARLLSGGCCAIGLAVATGCGGQVSPAPDDAAPVLPGPDELAETGHILELVSDSERLFWIDNEHAVRNLSKAGGSIETLEARADAAHLAVDREDVVWSGQTFGGLVIQPKMGSGRRFTTIVATASPIAVSGGSIYALNLKSTAIVRVPKDGSDAVPVIELNPLISVNALSVDKDILFWSDSRGLAWAPATKGEGTYFAFDSITRFTVDGPNVLWGGERSIWRALRTGGGKTMVASAEAAAPAVAVDDLHVYWVDSTGLWRVPKAGGDRRALWTGASSPCCLVADEAYIFWVARGPTGTERLLRLRRM